MKQCPKCKREYDDDSLRFCLEDGTQLAREDASPTIAGPTMVLPGNEPGPTTISGVARPDVRLPAAPDTKRHQVGPTQGFASPASLSPGTVRIVIGVLFIAGVVANIIALATWGFIILRRLPLVLLFLSAMLVAFVRARRHPKVSLLLGLALGFDLIETFIYQIINRSLIPLQSSLKIPEPQLQTLYTVLAVLDDFALAAILVLVTAAVLTGRKHRTEVAG
jgi:hypothetical protein